MKGAQIDFGKYRGEWVISCDNHVIAHHKDLTKIRDHLAKCATTPTITKVPKEEILIF